ncbi:MotA/TolQ/ExbB proton channel family protein [Rhodohalobacter sp. WB101]|uniref:MotA/TolQ/ExbB proton channel family protein n=2 Tax=Rhodohalobacter sulfatireducens TaxID=2911366 RepID=A0ABS9KBD6_9BACT|nr:MotA/TolQ/ExbB proton channel family protein [Rhodohalobacter sulfatireducens]
MNINLKQVKIMFDLFYAGGPLFMGILTIILVALIATAVYSLIKIKRDGSSSKSVSLVKEIGIFGFIFGIFGQFLGLYQAFNAIEAAGDVSPALLAGGLKVSMITTLYGMTIFVIAWLFYFGLKLLTGRE